MARHGDQPNDVKKKYAEARTKYRPAHIKTLLVAEAPPDSLDRFFYYENVRNKDSLFLEIMGVLYPARKSEYLRLGRPAELKAQMLRAFQSDGFWLLDLSELPLSCLSTPLDSCVSGLTERVKAVATQDMVVILIKATVFDCCYEALSGMGARVSPERLPFPGSGQQKIFRDKFKKALDPDRPA